MTDPTGSALSMDRPFPGLRPFDAADADFFYGRENQVYALYRLVTRSHFAAVVGSSGSGKSSLVRAGLLPLLEKEGRETGGRNWICLEMRPGDAPLERLAGVLTQIAADFSQHDDAAVASARRDRVSYRLRGSSFGIADALAQIRGIEKYTIVLLVDQFEELFRYAATGPTRDRAEEARSREEAAHFVQLLLEASRSSLYDIRVLITMRSDFIGDCARFQGLPEAVSASQFLVPSLDRIQREEVIRGPILKAQGTIEPALVERLLNDSDEELDQLPVLQHCLLRLWERAKAASDTPDHPGRHITLDDYVAIGGMAGALSQHADEILEKDLPEAIASVALVYRALCEFDQQSRITRRAVPFARLVAECGVSEDVARKIVDRFRADDCSFLTPSLSASPTLAPNSRVDVGHEALLRRWEKVSGDPAATGDRDDKRAIGWLREERRDGQRYQVLVATIENEAPGQALIPPDQLQRNVDWWKERPRTQAWAERWGGRYGEVDDLIRRSLAFREEEEKRQGEEVEDRRRSRRLKRLTVILCAVLALMAGAGSFIFLQYRTADKEADIARAQADAAGKAMSTAINVITNSYQRGAVPIESAAQMLNSIQSSVESLPDLTALGATQRLNLLLNISDTRVVLGDTKGAMELAEKARAAAEELASAEPDEAKYQSLIYMSLFRIGDMAALDSSDDGRKKSLESYQAAQAIAETLAKASPNAEDLQFNRAFITNKVGEVFQLRRDFPAAGQQFSSAIDIMIRITTLKPDNDGWQAYLASTQLKLASLLTQQPQPDLQGALDRIGKAIAIQNALLMRHADDKSKQSNLASSYRARGDVMKLMAKPTEALNDYQASLKMSVALQKEDPLNTSWSVLAANAYQRVGDQLRDQQNLQAAAEPYRNAVAIWQDLTRKSPENSLWHDRLERAQDRLASVQEGQQGSGSNAEPPQQPSPASPNASPSPDSPHPGAN